jgi:two-component system invasion response regulator UvrY
MKEPHVLIVDDHEIVRYGLIALIREHFPECTVEEADTYETMVEVLRQKKCTHMILDLQLRDMVLLQKLSQIRKEYPELYILVHTMSNSAEYSGWISGMGADAFLSKESGREEMIAVLTFFLRYNMSMNADAHRHQEHIPNGRRERPDDPFLRLSPREQELARLILKGGTSKEIQNMLRLKSSTVSTMKSRIFQKLNVSNLVGLVKLAEYCHFR